MRLLIKNGRVIDPANNLDEVRDILVYAGKIEKVAKNINNTADTIIEAKDKIVMPGIVDMHVHLREPGREDKETVASGTLAAAKGGVTSILAMPNTEPAIDSAQNVALLKNIINKTAQVNVFIAGSITAGRLGKELTDIARLKKEGVVAISDDGSSVDNEALMLRAFKKAKENNVLAICHCEDKSLSPKGVVNRGIISTRMGLRGIPQEAEYKRVKRDIELAARIRARLHIAHVSCSQSVEIIASAKKKGIKVTCETTPHHFSLDEEAALGFDTNMKMNPPLRNKTDMLSIRQALCSGIIDALASDHAPHTENEKEIEFERAEFGVIGLETELAVAITELIQTGLLSWGELVKRLALNPAKILGIDKPHPSFKSNAFNEGRGKGTLSVGADADIIVVSPEKEWLVEKQGLVSKSKNCAFLGKKLKGSVDCTICKGKVVYEG